MKQEKGFYARIPNYFFYNKGEFLKCIGGRNSFVLYCLLTSRKGMNDKVYINIKQINEVIRVSNNITYAKDLILKYLEKLEEYGLISFHFDIDNVKTNDTLCIEWNDLFDNANGWIPFYYNDFEIQYKIGNIPYCVMWMIRMYTNNNSETSYPSIRQIADTLRCDIVKVQNSIDLFDKTGVFKITRGRLYYNEEEKKTMKKNNEYIYTGNIDGVLSMDNNDIASLLNKKH